MKFHQMVVMVALLVAKLRTASSLCPAGCECSTGNEQVKCISSPLTSIPAGYWPNTTYLLLDNNQISSFDEASLTGFPNLVQFVMKRNPLKILDLNAFVGSAKLRDYGCWECGVEKILPLESGKKLMKLRDINLQVSKVKEIQPNLLEGCEYPGLDISLNQNPLVLSGETPFLSSPNLHYLTIGGVDATEANKETFKELPNLRRLYIGYSNITNVSDTFSVLSNLRDINFYKNPIKEIRKGFLSPGQVLDVLGLESTPLEVLETGAINGMLKTTLNIRNTPLACQCKYESLYWWAQLNGVRIWAECNNNPSCAFRRTKSKQDDN